MIAFPKPEPIASAGDVGLAEWNPHADPPRWEIICPSCCCDCSCGCCDTTPTSVEITAVDVYDCEEGGSTRL